ncbi:coiled-coil domain-containing protein [Sulfitobacter dubius]|uniref:hypothetical protein n=1 Tax=Sulfitobacter dubius TaxID=218673 RepID=UPI0029425B18|nr:hypothetical protein [Sulfitobacter dubius]WOI31297.1 hypothetical protein R1T39_18790 [Sulfitobacter dubius]
MKTAPARLVVHALPSEFAQKIARTLVNIGESDDEQREPISVDAAGKYLAEKSDATLCIIYQDPISALCTVMSANDDIASFLRNWTFCARQALQLHRRNRKRSMIIEAGHVQRFAAAGLARLNIEADSRRLREITAELPSPNPLDYILAKAILVENAEAQAAHDELSASAQALSNEDGIAPTNMALQAYATQKEQAEIANQGFKQKLDEKTARIELLLAQQADMIADMDVLEKALQQNTESSLREKDELQKQLKEETSRNSLLLAQQTAMICDMDTLEREMETANTRGERIQHEFSIQLKAANQAKDHITAERDQKAAELTAVLETQNQATADLAHRNDELAAAHAEIDRILNSRSMRLTQSLRSFANLLRGRH